MRKQLAQTKAPATSCAYCGEKIPKSQITRDHVIAGAWYPDGTQKIVQRWTVPACFPCNNRFSAIEQYVFVKLATCVDPTHPAAAGIWQRARAAISPEQAKTERERSIRQATRDAFMADTFPVTSTQIRGVLPFSEPNLALGSRTAVKIDAGKLDAIIAKWAKGLYAHLYRRSVTASAEVKVFHVHDKHAAEAFGEIVRFGRILDGGDGVHVIHWLAEDSERRECLFAFQIWGQFRAYASISERLR